MTLLILYGTTEGQTRKIVGFMVDHLESAGHAGKQRTETLEVAFVRIGEGEPVRGPEIQRVGYHTVKYFLPSRSC